MDVVERLTSDAHMVQQSTSRTTVLRRSKTPPHTACLRALLST
jgi:hypothetical protein